MNSVKPLRDPGRDETYVLDLCDRVLKRKSVRQHRFVFLVGDSGRQLPVDAYYPDLALVVEFRERQHVSPHAFFDRRPTVSGVTRGVQRALYDKRRRQVLPRNGIRLVELNVADFSNVSGRKLRRDPKQDLVIIRGKLSEFLK